MEPTISRIEAGTLKEEEDDQADGEDEDDEEESQEAAAPSGDAEEGDASLEDILTKKGEDGPAGGEDEDEESILSLGREDRIETLSVRVEPKKDTEFVCQNCYLVKPIRSQLADKKRMFCRDCA
jgi:hypothetical protein